MYILMRNMIVSLSICAVAYGQENLIPLQVTPQVTKVDPDALNPLLFDFNYSCVSNYSFRPFRACFI